MSIHSLSQVILIGLFFATGRNENTELETLTLRHMLEDNTNEALDWLTDNRECSPTVINRFLERVEKNHPILMVISIFRLLGRKAHPH